MKCANPKCDNDGFLSFRGAPDKKYCLGCYKYFGKKIAKIRHGMNMVSEARRLEAEDNQPARQPTSL